MSLAELLNPVIEAHNLFDATDQDIYNVVMEVKKLQDAEDSSDIAEHSDSDTPIDIILTCSKALQAARGLQKYVEEPDTAYASNFTVMLCAFG